MTRWKNLPAWAGLSALMLTLVLVVSILGPGLRKSWAKGGNWNEITMIYTTDIKGKYEPCG